MREEKRIICRWREREAKVGLGGESKRGLIEGRGKVKAKGYREASKKKKGLFEGYS